jgi:hypothetical protein
VSEESAEETDFWAPLWRRIAALVISVIWAAAEWNMGNQFFFALAGSLTVFSTYEFFISGSYRRS